VTNFGAISRTVWPDAWNSRAQWWAPEQASKPITQGGRRDQFMQLVAWHGRPNQLGIANIVDAVDRETFLARSIPPARIVMDFPFRNS
jgi:hypothetical protein